MEGQFGTSQLGCAPRLLREPCEANTVWGKCGLLGATAGGSYSNHSTVQL